MLSYIVAKTEEQRERLKKFAAGFDHEISFRYPVVQILRNDVLVAYVEIIHSPVLNFGISPDLNVARDTQQILSEVGAWAKIQHGEYIVVRPQDETTKFTDNTMDKLGFINMKKDVFVAKD